MKFKEPNLRSTLDCIESYQVLPTPALMSSSVPYCGNGANACARVAPPPQPAANPGNGSLYPAATTAGSRMFFCSNEPSARDVTGSVLRYTDEFNPRPRL